tara:strand:- start:540 stop:779 length:240 start_codon:yes stop_codon:yes gene_type:complete
MLSLNQLLNDSFNLLRKINFLNFLNDDISTGHYQQNCNDINNNKSCIVDIENIVSTPNDVIKDIKHIDVDLNNQHIKNN